MMLFSGNCVFKSLKSELHDGKIFALIWLTDKHFLSSGPDGLCVSYCVLL